MFRNSRTPKNFRPSYFASLFNVIIQRIVVCLNSSNIGAHNSLISRFISTAFCVSVENYRCVLVCVCVFLREFLSVAVSRCVGVSMRVYVCVFACKFVFLYICVHLVYEKILL